MSYERDDLTNGRHGGPGPSRTSSGWGAGTGSPAHKSGGIPDGMLLAALILLLGLTVLTWTATGLAALIAHGMWPEGVTFSRTPMAMRALAGTPHDLAGAWPDARASQLSGYGLFWGLFISQLLVLLVLTIFGLGTYTRARAVRAAHRAKTTASAHIPEQPETVREQASPARQPAADSGPRYPEPQPATGRPDARAVLDVTEPAPQPLGERPAPEPPASATEPATRIHEADGAVLVATDDAALWAATKDARAKLGPVHLFDPGQICDTPNRLRWSPHHGCARHATAATRAGALLAPLRSPRPIDAETHHAAETLLRCWLHAAGLDDRPFREVHRWALAKSAPAEPVQTLRTHPRAAAGTAGELEATLTSHPDRREAATNLIREALAPLSQLHVRNACTATRADRIALESFINETGTLYVVGADPELMPILGALTQSVVEHGRRMAAGSSPGRLGPPTLTSVLELPLAEPESTD
jgi:hypothetical protein